MVLGSPDELLLRSTTPEDINRHLLSPDEELMTNQCKDATRVQLLKPVHFICVTYRAMGEGLGITQKQLHHQRPPAPPSAWTMTGTLEFIVLVGNLTSWRDSAFPRQLTSLCFVHTTQLAYFSPSSSDDLRVPLSCFYCLQRFGEGRA